MALHKTLHNLQRLPNPQIYKVWWEYFSSCRVLNSNSLTWSLSSTLHTPEAKLLLLTLKTQTQARDDTISLHISQFLSRQLHIVTITELHVFVLLLFCLVHVDIVTS